MIVKPTAFERREERRHHAPFCRAGRRCVVCRAFRTRRLELYVRPTAEGFTGFQWRPFLGVAVAPWQVFGPACGLVLGTLTEEQLERATSAAVRIAGGRGYMLTVRRSRRLKVRT